MMKKVGDLKQVCKVTAIISRPEDGKKKINRKTLTQLTGMQSGSGVLGCTFCDESSFYWTVHFA